jgi:hypothetical protein
LHLLAASFRRLQHLGREGRPVRFHLRQVGELGLTPEQFAGRRNQVEFVQGRGDAFLVGEPALAIPSSFLIGSHLGTQRRDVVDQSQAVTPVGIGFDSKLPFLQVVKFRE